MATAGVSKQHRVSSGTATEKVALPAEASVPKKKKNLTYLEDLELHGITFEEEVAGKETLRLLPSHVSILRDGLLDFEQFLPQRAISKALYESRHSQADIPDSARWPADKKLERWESDMVVSFMERAKKISDGTLKWQTYPVPEASLQILLSATIFEDFGDAQHQERCFTPSIADAVNNVACMSHASSTWFAAESCRGSKTPLHITETKRPRPDFYFGFPIHDSTKSTKCAFGQDEVIQNFADKTLFHLENFGLCAAPTSAFSKQFKRHALTRARQDKVQDHHLVCFPWAIFEIKAFNPKDVSTRTTQVYCQAVNASSAALCMFETLTKFAKPEMNSKEIPPVVAFTCVGHLTKVWLAYSMLDEECQRKHRMICIWDGDLTKIWDSVQFFRIVNNLTSWAIFVLRPKISTFIDQWRAEYPTTTPNSRPKQHHSVSSFVQHVKERLLTFVPGSPDFADVVQLMESLKEEIATKLDITPTEQVSVTVEDLKFETVVPALIDDEFTLLPSPEDEADGASELDGDRSKKPLTNFGPPQIAINVFPNDSNDGIEAMDNSMVTLSISFPGLRTTNNGNIKPQPSGYRKRHSFDSLAASALELSSTYQRGSKYLNRPSTSHGEVSGSTLRNDAAL